MSTALFPTSENIAPAINWLDSKGRSIAGPQEWTPAFLCLPNCSIEISGVSIAANGMQLPVMLRKFGGQARLVAEWPRLGPGRYHIQSCVGGRSHVSEVVITSSKLSQDEYRSLLNDLEYRLPTLIVLGLKRLGGLADFQLATSAYETIAQELHRLQRAVEGVEGRPGIVEILPRLSRHHHRQLKRREYWKPRSAARRPSPAGLMAAIVRADNLERNGLPRQVLDSVAEYDADVYENQVVKLLVHFIQAGLRRLLGILPRDGELRAVVERLDFMTKAAVQGAVFLEAVSLPRRPPMRATMVLMNVPEYRAAFTNLLEFQRSIAIRFDEPQLESPLKNLPHLYQSWCTLLVIEKLQAFAAERGYVLRKQSIVTRHSGSAYVKVLRNGQPALTLRSRDGARTIRLIPERGYRRDNGRRDFYSTSFTQRPDITIEVTDYQTKSLFLLDPKYKLDSGGEPESGAPKKQDIDKMHAYRDAIRCKGKHAVTRAAILFPGATQHFGEVSAVGIRPSSQQDLVCELGYIFDDPTWEAASAKSESAQDDCLGS